MWLCSLPSSPPVLTRCSEYAAHKLPSSRPPVGVVSTQSSHHNVGFWRRAEDVAEAPAGGEELIDAGQARINGEKGRGAVARGVGVGACARRSVWGQVRQRGDRTHSHEIPSARSTTHPRHVHDTSRHVRDMSTTCACPRHAHDMSAIRPRHVRDMSTACPSLVHRRWPRRCGPTGRMACSQRWRRRAAVRMSQAAATQKRATTIGGGGGGRRRPRPRLLADGARAMNELVTKRGSAFFMLQASSIRRRSPSAPRSAPAAASTGPALAALSGGRATHLATHLAAALPRE